ncbi:sugar ABC transporter substrate-binding protein [Vreelandella arcis]|uniref:ABC-type sugar transport system, substrate-binding protein, contains N-terminal xre family HTH domain n=1 Tax=Vreelandella arcis TaxID=416873 RepID=A0A1H0HG75_9GAMM|nr:sugar ABC transporter substrate-binding protein [Halomonas arcis]SDO18053.1 ABC-type sugar transport system, substrate-binding protein, contains N-terminal xre family HTH domain [Halomonas arcis]
MMNNNNVSSTVKNMPIPIWRISALVLSISITTSAMAQEDNFPDDPIRIGFAAHSIDLGAIFGQLREGFRNHLDEAGLEYEFYQAAPDTPSSHAQMVQNLENFATQDLDYVLMGPTSLDLNEPGLNSIAESGAKLLMTDYERPEGGVPYDEAVLNWVVYSHDEMGYKTGDWLMHHFRGQGNFEPRIVMLWGPADSEISEARGGGVKKAFDEAEDMTVDIVYETYADFDRDLAYTQTERALAAYDFDAIVALNSYMSVSASSALMANGREPGEIVVAGMGGTIAELEGVALGEIGVAPFRDPRSMGRASAEALLQHLTGNEADIDKTVYATIPVTESVYSISQHVPEAMFDVNAFLHEHFNR